MRSILLGGLLVGLGLTACQSTRGLSGDPAVSTGLQCCTGRLTHLAETADGGRELRLVPRGENAGLLAPGQSELVCHLPAQLVPRFAAVLEKVAVGGDCEICGWLVRDRATDLHQMNPLTSIDPYPDR